MWWSVISQILLILPFFFFSSVFLSVWVVQRQLKLEKFCSDQPTFVFVEQKAFLGFREEVSVLQTFPLALFHDFELI